MHALTEYEGAVILISHDRHLIEACADRLWVVRDGTRAALRRTTSMPTAPSCSPRAVPARARGRAARSETPRGGRADQRRAAADRRASLAPLKKAMQSAEKSVEALNAEIAKLDRLLADPELYARDAARAKSAGIERGQLVKRRGAGRGGVARRQRSLRERERARHRRDAGVTMRAARAKRSAVMHTKCVRSL